MVKAPTLEEALVDAEHLSVETQDQEIPVCQLAVTEVTQGYPPSGTKEPHQVDLQQTRPIKEIQRLPKPRASIRTPVPMHQ